MTTILQRFKEGIVNGYKETGDELRNDIPASEGNCKQGQQFDTTDDELKSRDPEPNSPTRSPVENLSPEFLAESVEKSTNETKDVFDNTKEDKAMTCVFCREISG
ncbi:uncharacterized protein LOC124450226 isoform X2 [Xenia sp. Carnegie-2017]|uniref:uncharacterized protein LOC124450226 isoform X2 n=1 Tax=Xenia sp. Carnegie-2017 TaxID=2897299 RepID=UPI001F03D690|nr:uncharacterized protein LOC124450226 isoform X2 [Xenia sp. Carnegie-2017]